MTGLAPDRLAERTQARWRLGLISLAALIAVVPLMRNGCSCGHDFDFHLVSWFEAASQISHGTLYPHWAFTPAFNAGEPRFVFYPPLSWMLGAVLGLLLTHLPGVSESAGWSAAPVLFTWIALTASGLTFHRLARLYVGANAAVLAAVVYAVNPYMLFTAYERTAYGELLAAAWIPLLFHSVFEQRIRVSQVALAVALLWLTNAPAAVMGSYTLAALALIRTIASARRAGVAEGLPVALRALGGGALGLGLAAFYVVPAAYERRFVHIAMATITGMRIDQNFLFEHTGTTADEVAHDLVLHTASLIAVGMLVATAVALVATRFRRDRGSVATALPVLPLAILTAGIAFALTPLSLPFWNLAPEAAFLQFTWRLLAILAPILALAIADALDRYRIALAAVAVSAVVAGVVLTLPAYRSFQQPCDDEDTASARLALFHSSAGTEPTDEYTPATADNDALTSSAPPYWLTASANAAPPEATAPGATPLHVRITAPQAEELILNLRNYPAWQVSVNGEPVQHPAGRPDGLIAIAVPAGASTVDVRYLRTWDQTAGDLLSALAAAILVLSLRARSPI